MVLKLAFEPCDGSSTGRATSLPNNSLTLTSGRFINCCVKYNWGSTSCRWKRFTIDVSVDLHRRIKTACASPDLEMATWMRELLEINVAPLENSPRK